MTISQYASFKGKSYLLRVAHTAGHYAFVHYTFFKSSTNIHLFIIKTFSNLLKGNTTNKKRQMFKHSSMTFSYSLDFSQCSSKKDRVYHEFVLPNTFLFFYNLINWVYRESLQGFFCTSAIIKSNIYLQLKFANY